MVATRSERAILVAAWRTLYAGAKKYPISEIPVGSTVLVRVVDEHVENEDDVMYEIMIVFRQSSESVRCASIYADQIDDSYTIPPTSMVVPLGGIANCVKPESTKMSKKEKEQKLRQQSQTRNNKLVMYCDNKSTDNRAYYLTNVRHNKYGQPTSGSVVNGGWRVRIGADGSFYVGDRTREKLYSVTQFSIVYVPNEIAAWINRPSSYESIMEWADKIPTDMRTRFEFEEGKIAMPLITQSVEGI